MAGKFKPGQSGNPNGRPKGTGKANYRKLLEPRADALVKKLIEQALDGDTSALGLCINRLIPSLKPREEAVQIDLGQGTLTDKANRILACVASGEIAASEGTQLISSLSALVKVIELDDFERRLSQLEQQGLQHEH